MQHERLQAAASPWPSQSTRRTVLTISCLLGISVFFIADSYWPDGGFVHESIEWVGTTLILICVVGRTWCVLYIGNSKNTALVDDGPYSVVRHPLYLFSIIGAIGVGAQAGGFTAALVAGFVTWVVLLRMSQIEEDNMLDLFGAQYFRYMMRVSRFKPNLSLYHSREALQVYPRQIVITFFDAMVFFVAVPLMEVFDYLHDTGLLPTLFRLP